MRVLHQTPCSIRRRCHARFSQRLTLRTRLPAKLGLRPPCPASPSAATGRRGDPPARALGRAALRGTSRDNANARSQRAGGALRPAARASPSPLPRGGAQRCAAVPAAARPPARDPGGIEAAETTGRNLGDLCARRCRSCPADPRCPRRPRGRLSDLTARCVESSAGWSRPKPSSHPRVSEGARESAKARPGLAAFPPVETSPRRRCGSS